MSSPTQETLDEQELDAQVIPAQDARISITDRAAEVCSVAGTQA